MTEKQITKAHDHFFRQMMSNKVVATTFFEAHLPHDVLAVTDLTTLEMQSGSYIDDIRKESIADILYKTKIRGHDAYLYLLVDHQSRPDPLMPFRLLKYVCNVIDQSIKESRSNRIPLVLPMVVYHGKQSWHYSTDINDLVDAPRKLIDAYFLKPFTLLDLNKIDDAELKRKTWSGVMEFTLKHIFARDMLPYVQDILLIMSDLIRHDGSILAENVLAYIIDRGEIGDEGQFLDLINARLSPDMGEKIMTLAERFEQRGVQKGMQQEKEQIAARLLQKNENPADVAELTGLPLERITELKRNLH